jgi:hypothetical protein
MIERCILFIPKKVEWGWTVTDRVAMFSDFYHREVICIFAQQQTSCALMRHLFLNEPSGVTK